jgi:hypothetical protein
VLPHGENWTPLPYRTAPAPASSGATTHVEFVHVDPAGQTAHEGPHAFLSLVVSTHEVPQRTEQSLQVKIHVVPEQVFVADVDVPHAAHVPPQHIPDAQGAPSMASPVKTQIATPVAHDVVPVWQTFPLGAHVAPEMHAVHTPSKQTSFVPQGVPLATLPMGLHADKPDTHDVIPVWHTLPPGLHRIPGTHVTHVPSLHI